MGAHPNWRATVLPERSMGSECHSQSGINPMDEGRKRVLAIVAGILVARHPKTADDLFDSKPSPRTESMVAAAVRWAERIMRKIDNVFPCKEQHIWLKLKCEMEKWRSAMDLCLPAFFQFS
jgi:hypothetical protein